MIRFIPTCIVLSFVLLVGCAPKQLGPVERELFNKNQLVIRIGELQTTVISLHDSPQNVDKHLITKERANQIVQWTVTALQIIKASVIGWKELIKTSWQQLNLLVVKPAESLNTVWLIVSGLVGSL